MEGVVEMLRGVRIIPAKNARGVAEMLRGARVIFAKDVEGVAEMLRGISDSATLFVCFCLRERHPAP